MTINRRTFLILLALVIFLVGVILTAMDNLTGKAFPLLLFGGLAFFAAAFLP